MTKKPNKSELPPKYSAFMLCKYKQVPAFRNGGKEIKGGVVVPFTNFDSQAELETYVKYYCMKFGIESAEAISQDQAVTPEHKQLFKNVKDYQDQHRYIPEENNESNTQI